MKGIRIGELLVEQGILSPKQVDHIIHVQRSTQRPFGDLAEKLFGIDPKAVEDAWVQQYLRLAGTVDLEEQRIDTECLRTLNRRQAWQFQALPLHRQELDLQVATTADNLVRAVNFATRSLDEPVYFLIAEHQQLREFLMKHYPVPEFLARYASNMG
ncbi:MAG TPA: hypothetical protein VFE58_08370 [Tepidisphaeraceae bacterium]|nr:hypothetical protein [Tepidisphaeraceae bacterium]